MINLCIHFVDISYLASWTPPRGGPIFLYHPIVDRWQVAGADDIWLLVLKTGASHSQTILLFDSHFEQGQLFCSIAVGFHFGEDSPS